MLQKQQKEFLYTFHPDLPNVNILHHQNQEILHFTSCPFAGKGSHVAFGCHVSLIFFKLGQFFHFSLAFMTLILLNSPGQLFCRICLIWACLMFPHDQIQAMLFEQNYLSFSVHHISLLMHRHFIFQSSQIHQFFPLL